MTGLDQSRFEAADVRLAVEVVSLESEARDHDTTPRKYAAAGIPHFWLVEMARDDAQPVVRVYEADPLSKTYALTGIHRDRLKVSSPYEIDIDISLSALKKL
ncbi:hypothetical protein GCM10010329_47650 [Streptomyces spiroverticillatus]|uniref:Putative restriction endonuclease domain-containing protein n=1 Tax=Streptomyces finlayi TaxID=67296 RepID=A0A918X168_9ACTN|nr:hypothetical protein GCM10010329_47650 [Streptomyces spiroverticillatus]GHD02250.1 hypothetical protein GCM10010334_48600 [Streptomyces finlayi]